MLLQDLKHDKEAWLELVRDHCEHDLEAFSVIFFPHYCRFSFNQFHKDCFEYYKENKRNTRRMDGAPRGYAKSTIKTLIKPIHDLCYGYEKYILFISATNTQAIQKLKDIRREILSNDLLADAYGVQFPNKNPGAEAFEVFIKDSGVQLQAVGAGTEIRGLRYGAYRPTKIILDDVEDSEEIFNEELREKTKDWFSEVVSNLGDVGTNIEVVGTILHRDSLLMKIARNPSYESKIYKAIISWATRTDLWDNWKAIYTELENENRALDADKYFQDNKEAMMEGVEVLWPEKEPYHVLMKEMVEKGQRAFMKEKQNAPLPSDEALFDVIHWYREDKERGGLVIEKSGAFIPYKDLYAFGACDPATGESRSKSNGKLDFTCIVSGYKDTKGRLFVHRDYTKRVRPNVYIAQIFEHYLEMKYDKFAIEYNLYRNLLLENILREKKKIEAERKKNGIGDWGIQVPFYEIEQRDKKEKRIFTLEPKINNGWILFNRTLSMDFMQMIEEFPSGDHDDAPDALEMLWSLANNRYKAEGVKLDPMGSR
jgi:predicted phage terminase large subunit-like protein